MGANARVATALALIFALAFVPRVLSQDTEKPPLPVSLKTIPVPGQSDDLLRTLVRDRAAAMRV